MSNCVFTRCRCPGKRISFPRPPPQSLGTRPSEICCSRNSPSSGAPRWSIPIERPVIIHTLISHFLNKKFRIIFYQIVDNSSLLHVRRDQPPEERVVPLVRQLRGEKRNVRTGGRRSKCGLRGRGGKDFNYLDGGGGVAQHCDLRRRRKPITSIPSFVLAQIKLFEIQQRTDSLIKKCRNEVYIFSPTWYACSTGETARETEL